MDRMSALDASFFFAESENTPMHVGSVTVFEGPAPSYGDVVRLLLSKMPLVPRYRQRVRPVPMQLGRPLWVDDPHFQILYHVRHTAVPSPGSDEQLRNLAGRVLGQRLDMAKPLWELWLVEGLADGRWALISKVHHCMVDGVAGTDLMQLMFDLEPDATHAEPTDWTPQRDPSTMSLVAGAFNDAVAHPLQQAAPCRASAPRSQAAKELAASGKTIASAVPSLAKQAITPTARSLNGPIGPHRRWAWTDGKFEEFKAVRTAFGGTVNDVVLTAITGGFRDLLAGPRRAVVGEARRPLDGAGVGAPAGPEGQAQQPGLGRVRRPARRAGRPGRPADRDPRPDGRVQEDDAGGGRAVDHRAGRLRRADAAGAWASGPRCRPARCGARR